MARSAVEAGVRMRDSTDKGGDVEALRAEVARLTGLLDASEAERARLVFELGHRVKNTLSVVQGLAGQTLRGPAPRDEALEAFGARVMALSRANDLILNEGWTTATVGAVAHAALTPAASERLRMDGPEVRISASAALSFAMALHELGTNARRHGALGTPTGRVDLLWGVEPAEGPSRFHLAWSETGGPPARAPEKRGFGLKLIEQSLRSAFGREVAVELLPRGLRCTVRAPLPTPA